jgi:outer membrane protein
MDFQDKVQKGLVTRSTAQQMQQDLAAKEQELYQYRDELRMQFSEEEQVMLRRIQHSITDYLKKYNKEKGYQVILSGTFGGPVLYGNPAIEITQEVLVGLNEEYNKNKTSK